MVESRAGVCGAVSMMARTSKVGSGTQPAGRLQSVPLPLRGLVPELSMSTTSTIRVKNGPSYRQAESKKIFSVAKLLAFQRL